MMRRLNIETKVTILKAELLTKLRANLEQHKSVVIEARKGYVAKAKDHLRASLADLESGRVKSIAISLQAPQDMSETYVTTIAMMEMHQSDTIQLTASEFRMLVLDEWDWSDHFWMQNAAYSATAASKLGPPMLDID